MDVLHEGGLDSGTKQFDSGSTSVRQWRQKRVLMRPEAAFPYVFAAEGAQHPPKSRHAQRSPPKDRRSTIGAQHPVAKKPPQQNIRHETAATTAAGETFFFAATKKGLYIKKSPVQCLTESDYFVWSQKRLSRSLPYIILYQVLVSLIREND